MTDSTFRFKVFGVASLLAASILIVVLVAQRPTASGGAVIGSDTVAHSAR